MASLWLVGMSVLVVPQQCIAVTVNTVLIGNPGNAADPADGDQSSPGIQNFGAVAYGYRMGTTEVTVGQYTEFLNAVAVTDTYSLYNPMMGTNLNVAGIARSGAAGTYSYSVIGSPDKPVTYVSWGDAARFTNWLQHGQPTGAQGASTTETGAYSLNGAITNSALCAVSRNAGAQWFIPTENEWYKAALYQPAAQGGDADNYWAYPTRANVTPNSDQPPGAAGIEANVANFYRLDGGALSYNNGFAVTGSSSFSATQNYLTDVGTYTQTSSFYGTFDQAGNAAEWNEGLISGLFRGQRGGSFMTGFSGSATLADRGFGSPANDVNTVGFRVATVTASNGDLNLDGVVDIQDITNVANHWLESGMAGDANHDGVVDIQDITLIANHWLEHPGGGGGAAMSQVAIPEPGTLALALLGGLASLSIARRRIQNGQPPRTQA